MIDLKEKSPTYSKILTKEKPKTLYHYTTPSGILGIVQSSNIWATDIRFLNDKKEFRHTLDIIHLIITEFHKVGDEINIGKDFSFDFIEYLQMELRNDWNPEVYVTSFTEMGNLLSQWRGYCPKGGYSVGFKFKFLSQIAAKHESNLLPCVYPYRIKKNILVELMEYYSKIYEGSPIKGNQGNPDELGERLSKEFVTDLITLAPILKHKSFSEEKEWRIVSSSLRDNPTIKFRSSNYGIIPYFEFPLCESKLKMNIKQIFIGPGNNNIHSKEALKQLLNKNNINFEKIIISRTPIRSS